MLGKEREYTVCRMPLIFGVGSGGGRVGRVGVLYRDRTHALKAHVLEKRESGRDAAISCKVHAAVVSGEVPDHRW